MSTPQTNDGQPAFPQPTPETDANEKLINQFTGCHLHASSDFARNLERQRNRAVTLNRSLLDQLEAKDVQLEAMREANGVAQSTLQSIYLDDIFDATMREIAKTALAKLQPFLKP